MSSRDFEHPHTRKLRIERELVAEQINDLLKANEDGFQTRYDISFAINAAGALRSIRSAKRITNRSIFRKAKALAVVWSVVKARRKAAFEDHKVGKL